LFTTPQKTLDNCCALGNIGSKLDRFPSLEAFTLQHSNNFLLVFHTEVLSIFYIIHLLLRGSIKGMPLVALTVGIVFMSFFGVIKGVSLIAFTATTGDYLWYFLFKLFG